MWNPFSKKNHDFKLDEEKLPSLSEHEQNTNLQEDLNPSSNEVKNPFAEPDSPQNFGSQEISATDIGVSSTNTLGGMTSTYQDQMNAKPSVTNSNSTHHEDLSKAKMETIEAKVTLMDARLSSIEQKIEILTQMIYSEISDETKKKINVGNMMKKIK